MVYDVTDQQSFQKVDNWIRQVKIKAPNAEVILVGTKIDKDNRVISTEQGQALANTYNFPFFEVSNKTGQNVKEAFQALTSMVLKDQEAEEEEQK